MSDLFLIVILLIYVFIIIGSITLLIYTIIKRVNEKHKEKEKLKKYKEY